MTTHRQSAPWQRAVVVGRGRAGGALALSLRRAGVHVDVVSGRRMPRALPRADIVFVAVPDGAIGAVAAQVRMRVDDDVVIAHLAGARGLEALGDVARAAVFHPLASLDAAHPIPDGTLCAWDARRRADARPLRELAVRLRMTPARVEDDGRAHYHAGAVIAGNLAVALLSRGVDELVRGGVPRALARIALARLLASTAERAEATTLPRALTGPVARGDAATLRRHLGVLDDDTAALYRHASTILIDEVAPHDDATRRVLRRALAARRATDEGASTPRPRAQRGTRSKK